MQRLAAILRTKAPKATTSTSDDPAETIGHSRLPSTGSECVSSDGHKHDTHLPLDVRDPRIRFQNAVRTVIKLQRTAGHRATPVPPGFPRRDSWQTSPLPGLPDSGLLGLRWARVSKAIEELKSLELSQELFPHGALVRHIQFSPNGRYFATASWDRTGMIFRVREKETETEESESEMESETGETETFTSFRPLPPSPLTHYRTLVHTRGFVSQVAWSPNGRLLLTRFARGIKLWSEDGVCRQTIDRPRTVNSAVWLPNGQAILSVEGHEVVKLDLHGKVLDVYYFDHVRLVNVVVTSDCSRLIAIGPAVPPADGPQPTYQTKVEKRIIVYNMHTKRKESQAPLFHDVRDIAISRQMPYVLVSFELATPQLWKLEIVRDRARANGENSLTARLVLKHTFALKAPTSIVGSCYLGGNDEQFVYCVSKVGDVHIWDRETAALLHYMRPLSELEVTCIGWNNAIDEPMFATGGHDGRVRVWSTWTEGLGSIGSPTVTGSDLDTLVESVGRSRV